jgi:hypothetical protein
MPFAEEYASRGLAWLRRHRAEILDVLALSLALLAIDRYVAALTFWAGLCALAPALLVPARQPAPGASRGRAFLAGLPRRAGCFAVAALLFLFLFSLPPRSLWFGPAWLVLILAVEWDWAPQVARMKRAGEWIERNRNPRAEGALRALLVVLVPVWLMRGFLSTLIQGGGDAGWYGAVLADMVAQVRAGVFPVWVGQSAYQFNGSISPVRIAPAFNYLGAFLDTLTLHRLGTVALLNLLLVSIAVAAMATCYLCLRTVLPRARWLALALSALFLACPAVVGLPYNAELYMSWTTLPLIPVIWLATVRSFQAERERGALLLLGAALGLSWWGHSPIALWSTLLAGCTQAWRVVARRGRGVDWEAAVGAALLFSAIAAYPVGSVLFFPPETGVHLSEVQRALPGTIVDFIGAGFPGAVLPLSTVGRSEGDIQFGYALWGLLLFCLAYEYRSTRTEGRVLLTAAFVLALLLLPIPGLSLILWNIVPAFVRNPTGNWAAPRLYLLMAAATVFAAAVGSAEGLPLDGRRRRWLALLIGCGCLWSIIQAGNFAAESRVIAISPNAGVDRLSPENLQLTRYSYGMFPRLPSTFTHGVADPRLENHLLSKDSLSRIAANGDTALSAGKTVKTEAFVKRRHGDSDFIELEHPMSIEPGHSYLIEFSFRHPEYAVGVLQVTGPGLFREYGLPEHGGPGAFGVGGTHTDAIPIWTSAPAAQEFNIRFFPSADITMEHGLHFSEEARLVSFDPEALPVRVDSWIPYSARVTSPSPAWLETPRMYQPGYLASVDGQPALTRKSDDGFVCVAVPAGNSKVTLTYAPPTGLKVLFWVSALAILGSVVLGAAAFLGPATAAGGTRGSTHPATA